MPLFSDENSAESGGNEASGGQASGYSGEGGREAYKDDVVEIRIGVALKYGAAHGAWFRLNEKVVACLRQRKLRGLPKWE